MKQKIQTSANKALIFLVPIWRFEHFKYILKNTKLKQVATCFSNHSLDLNLSKSLGPLKTMKIFLMFTRGRLKEVDLQSL